jgi:NADPH-dependent 2,4-dienoyl-CoA reductase/sulfur reductase-like enzyme
VENVDLAIIGGGPAGLAAAIGAREEGLRDILILERDYNNLGGILNQCIHNGFGLHRFKEELTGPEYAERDINRIREMGIKFKLGTMVLDVSPDKVLTAVNEDGLHEIRARAVVLAMGCRERPRGALNIPGTRPAGVFTAGTAQKFVNLDGYMPGSEVVILGSGDIGLIMARRMTLEGAKVKAVAELMPFSGGLKRNIVQCLDDYGIPLLLSHTVTRIVGRERVEGVDITEVDAKRQPIPGTTRHYPCDTLLLSVGLLPENELSKSASVELSPVTGGAVVGESLQTNVDGVFACGNVLHVHDLVDFVSGEAGLAGRNAARYVKGRTFVRNGIPVVAAGGVRYTVPFTINPGNLDDQVDVRFRVGDVYRDQYISVYFDSDREVHRKARILTPGEMETVTLKKEVFDRHPGVKAITVTVEKD